MHAAQHRFRFVRYGLHRCRYLLLVKAGRAKRKGIRKGAFLFAAFAELLEGVGLGVVPHPVVELLAILGTSSEKAALRARHGGRAYGHEGNVSSRKSGASKSESPSAGGKHCFLKEKSHASL